MIPIQFTMVEFVEFLNRLTARSNEDAFVVLEDADTKKFVQFGRGPTIKLDLPLAALSDVEADRASAFFRKLGVLAPRELSAPDPSQNNRLRRHATFEYDFGSDATLAATTSLELFAAVYGITPTPQFRLIEN